MHVHRYGYGTVTVNMYVIATYIQEINQCDSLDMLCVAFFPMRYAISINKVDIMIYQPWSFDFHLDQSH